MVKQKIMRKEWYPIFAPRVFNNAFLGETHVYESRQMMGKGLTINLMNLTNDAKRQNININFEVVDVQNGKGLTNVIGYNMVQSSIKRLIRRNIEKVDMSFFCKTSDNKDLQVKPILITRSATKGSVVARIRRTVQDFIVKYVGSVSYDNLVNDLVNHKLQSLLKKDINKIYPLRICEIRSMEVIDLEKKKEAKAKAVAKESKGAKEKVKETEPKKEESKATEKKEAAKAEEVKEVKESKDIKKEEKKSEKAEQKA